MSNPIVVLGGGISGLSCAHYINQFAGPLLKGRKIIVVEANKHLGGWIKTVKFDDGVYHETGPKSVRLQGLAGWNTLALADQIGLSKEVLGIPIQAPQANRRFVIHNNQLCQMPIRPSDLFSKKPPFTKRLYKYVLQDYRTPKVLLENYGGDISVYDYINHRLGKDIAEYFFDPFCRGVTAGDCRKLSMVSAFAETFRGEQVYGSVLKGMFAPKTDVTLYMDCELVRFAHLSKWTIWTLKEGLQTLPDRFCNYLLNLENNPVEIYNESRVKELDFDDQTNVATIHIETSNQEDVVIKSDFVFSAIPAYSLANVLLNGKYSTLAKHLNEISAVDMGVVYLEYSGKVIDEDLGFGCLAPTCEQTKILGIVFDSCIFPNFDGEKNITRLTCMLGGAWFKEIFGDINSPDIEEKLLSTSIEAAQKYLGIKVDPIRHMISLHRKCIPQYYLGHHLKLQKIDEEIKRLNLNLILLGSSYKGISINDCIFNAKSSAENFSRSLYS